MANEEHLALLRQGVAAWNAWRMKEPLAVPDLSQADLSEADLEGADLHEANLSGADLEGADLQEANLTGATLMYAQLSLANLTRVNLYKADLRGATLRGANLRAADLIGAEATEADFSEATLDGADVSGADVVEAKLHGSHLSEANLAGTDLHRAELTGANLSRANLSGAKLIEATLNSATLGKANLSGAILSKADLRGADLRGADLGAANLSWADLTGADLTEAILHGAMLVRTSLANAVLIGCRVYGISAWDVKFNEATTQQDLVITPLGDPEVTADDLEVAQFIYLLLHNDKLRRIIDTITSKVVLIIGRFSQTQKVVLDALRDELRKCNYVPVVFDFQQPRSRTTDETITLLARMARFVIADISDAKSVLQELRGFVPECPWIPVQPIIVADQEEPGMFDFIKRFPWVLEPHRYVDREELLNHLSDRVIAPAEAKVTELRARNS